MSAVYYCDICNALMKTKDHRRVKITRGKLQVEVMHSLNGTWNQGNVCHKCIRACFKGKP